jgi:hypothetical protein
MIAIRLQRGGEGMGRLPTTDFRRKRWFVDVRLREIRNVDNPHESVTFDEWEKEKETEVDSAMDLVERQIALDDLVHDVMSAKASAINNDGEAAQFAFLKEEGWTVEAIEKAIKEKGAE